MRTERFDFTGADGQRLSGRLDIPEGPTQPPQALFAHCFTCTKASLAAVRIARALAQRGIAVLRFDFTGLGESGGDFGDTTFSANVRDVVAAAHALAAAGRPPALLIGHSLGGAAVLAAAAQIESVRAVATIGSPFDAAHLKRLFTPADQQRLADAGEAAVDLGGRPFTVRRALLDDLDRHDPRTHLATLGRALLVLHSPRDAQVDASNAAAIFQAARHPKSFVSLDDADHLLTREADAQYAAEVIAAWASRYVGAREPVLRRAADHGEVVVEDTGVGDFQVDVRAGGARFVADEPVEVGGLGSGPTPYDLLCAGLGACTVMTLRMYARRKGLALTKVRATVGHRRDAGANPPDVFERRLAIDGDLSDEQRSRLLDIADRCPVHRTLEHGARVQTGWDGAAPAAAADRLVQAEPAGQHAADMQHAAGAA